MGDRLDTIRPVHLWAVEEPPRRTTAMTPTAPTVLLRQVTGES